jgi:hypothetical protein
LNHPILARIARRRAYEVGEHDCRHAHTLTGHWTCRRQWWLVGEAVDAVNLSGFGGLILGASDVAGAEPERELAKVASRGLQGRKIGTTRERDDTSACY